MSLFDDLKSAAGNLLGSDPENLLASAQAALGETGGVQGVLQKLKDAGYGDKVASWLGSEENHSISADDIKTALAPEQLTALAGKFGFDTDKISALIAEFLPSAVDKASPDGELAVPPASDDKSISV